MTGFRRVRAFLEGEALNASRSAAFRLTVVFYAAALLVGAWNSVAWTQRRLEVSEGARREYDGKVAETRLRLMDALSGKGTPERFSDPRNPWSVGAWALRPPASVKPNGLAALAVGQTDILPLHQSVSMFSRHNSAEKDEIQNPALMTAGRFDLAFVIVFLLPLALIALCFDIVSSEREAGTWPLLRAQALTPGAIVAGKGLLRGAALILPSVAAGLAAVAVAAPSEGNRWAEFGVWAAAVTFYGAFWIACAAAVNLLGKSSAACASILVCLWLSLAIAVPAALDLAVSRTNPPGDRLAFVLDMRRAAESIDDARLREWNEAYYRRFPEDLLPGMDVIADYRPGPMQKDHRRFLARFAYFDDQVRPLAGSLENARLERNALLQRWSFLSPALSLQLLSENIGETGFWSHAAYLRDVDAFQDEWRLFFARIIFRLESMRPEHFDRLPAFRFTDAFLSERKGAVLMSLAALAGLSGLSIGGIAIALRRRLV